MLLQIFKVEKNYFSIKGLKTKGLKNLAGEESVKESYSILKNAKDKVIDLLGSGE